jgi:hypothetical protein
MPDSWCPAISADAITSAAGAIWDVHTNGPVPVDKGQWCNLLARAALEAVAPVIAAAERESILGELLKRHRPVGSEWGHSCMTCWTRGGGRAAWPCAESLAIGALLTEEESHA